MVLKKHEIEAALHAEHQDIAAGRLKEDSPLDDSEGFLSLCEASRRGDLKVCQERIQEGVNINARDRFDYTPLILASLCGHFEVVQLLLEAGALCERDTFQGERALYNALTDKIRNLLISYDYSKSRDLLQPLAGHITSLLNRQTPDTSDIVISTESTSFRLHKFILSARSPYFARKLAAAPETTTWRVPSSIPERSFEIALRALYMGEVGADFDGSPEDQAVVTGIEKLGRQLEMERLFDTILEADRRVARQKRSEEISRGRDQLESWFTQHILGNQLEVDAHKVDSIKWDRQNGIFADVLLCADPTSMDEQHHNENNGSSNRPIRRAEGPLNGIPVGPSALRHEKSRSPSRHGHATSTIIPAHRAILIRSEYYSTMFSSAFREAQESTHLPIVRVDCSPEVLRVVLSYLYTEQCTFGLDIATDVLFAADHLLIEKLKVKAAVIISTLGNGDALAGEDEDEAIDIYQVLRAGWDLHVHRLEEFSARYIAYRLERYIDEADFRELVCESAARITARQETDTVELIDDIRYYLSERFRLRFEDSGFDELEETAAADTSAGVGDDGIRPAAEVPADTGMIRTLDGDLAGDEFAQDALNYQLLLGKIETLLEELKLDA